MKFYYFIVAQIDLISNIENITENYEIINNKIRSIFPRENFYIWNNEHIKHLENYYNINDVNLFTYCRINNYEVSQKGVLLKGGEFLYLPQPHKNDVLRSLTEIGNTYFIYSYEKIIDFKLYYSINELDPRLNSLFRKPVSIKEKLGKIQEVYNVKSFYGTTKE